MPCVMVGGSFPTVRSLSLCSRPDFLKQGSGPSMPRSWIAKCRFPDSPHRQDRQCKSVRQRTALESRTNSAGDGHDHMRSTHSEAHNQSPRRPTCNTKQAAPPASAALGRAPCRDFGHLFHSPPSSCAALQPPLLPHSV